MRRAAVLLVCVLSLAACGDSGSDDALPEASASAGSAYSDEVRENFLTSCIENATKEAGESASREQLTQTCECILGKVEQEFSETEFAEFEQRLLSGEASDQENAQLVGWSQECASDAAS